MIYLITGLPGTGKTTAAEKLRMILESKDRKVVHFDGDVIRQCWPSLGYSEEERALNVKRIGDLTTAALITSHDVIISIVAPSRKSRLLLSHRFACFQYSYTEIYLNEVWERRPDSYYPEYEEGTPDIIGADAFTKYLESL
jgi:adenylylsulfate kinase-like enzyme